jgi:hypothetical protein
MKAAQDPGRKNLPHVPEVQRDWPSKFSENFARVRTILFDVHHVIWFRTNCMFATSSPLLVLHSPFSLLWQCASGLYPSGSNDKANELIQIHFEYRLIISRPDQNDCLAGGGLQNDHRLNHTKV